MFQQSIFTLGSSGSGSSVSGGPSISVRGPTSAYVTQTITLNIIDYDDFDTYTVTAATGTISHYKATITYTAPSEVPAGGTDTITIQRGGSQRNLTIQILPAGVVQPTIVSPVNGVSNVGSTILFESSEFATYGRSDTHTTSEWELATDPDFINVVASSTTGNLTAWIVSGLSTSTTYYARVRHVGQTYGPSAWSPAVSFTTTQSFFPQTETAKIWGADTSNGNRFGHSVSISADGNTCIVGASYNSADGNSSYSGAAYIFTKSNRVWVQQTKLSAPDKASNDYFGSAVAISADGNTCIVGAYSADPGGTYNAGAAYVFVRSGGTWEFQQKLFASDKADYDYFGSAVAISADGNTCIVGAYSADPGVIDAGAAYVFVRSNGVWTVQAKLTANDKVAYDKFGSSVAISSDGNRCAVGASEANVLGVDNAGAVYIFERNSSGVWTQTHKLAASDRNGDDQFGNSISMSTDGNTIVVGAHKADVSGVIDAGAAYVYVWNGSQWIEQAKLTAFDRASQDYFGNSVSVSADGNACVVGAYMADPNGVSSAGAAYVFTKSNGTWVLQNKITASDKRASGSFGHSVAIAYGGNTCVVGSVYATSKDAGTLGGAAYIFE